MRRSAALLALLAGCAAPPRPPPPPEAAAPAVPPPREPWRAERPRPGPAPALVVPEFRRAELGNGLAVYACEQPSLPLVSVAVAFRAGAGADPPGQAGVAELAYGLLLEGAGQRDGLQLADAFADLGVSPQRRVELDGASISVTVLASHAEAAVSLLADVVRRPRLAPADLERRRRQQLADLAARMGEPFFLARWAAAEAVYGGNHPYGHPAAGLPGTVSRLGLADARRFLAEHVGPGSTALVLAGQVTLAEARALADRYLGSWRSPARAPPPPVEPAVRRRTVVELVPKPGLEQTVILAARPGVPAGHPDVEALRVADAVFGGQFSSRLNMNLREQRGYTYGAFSYVQALRGAGAIVAASQVRRDVTGDSLAQMVAEMRGLEERPVTAKEMEDARDGIALQLPGLFDTDEALGRAAAALYCRDLPLDHYRRRVAALRGLDLAAVRSAATRYFDPALVQLVLVGDRAVAEKQVPPLGLGPIAVRPAPSAPGRDAAP